MEQPHRIEIHGAGLGIADDSLVARRARELAHIDGRSTPEGRDVAAAQLELTHGAPSPASLEGPENLQAWNEAPGETGAQTPRVGLEDEKSSAETLIEEGLSEADHDTRVAASKRSA